MDDKNKPLKWYHSNLTGRTFTRHGYIFSITVISLQIISRICRSRKARHQTWCLKLSLFTLSYRTLCTSVKYGSGQIFVLCNIWNHVRFLGHAHGARSHLSLKYRKYKLSKASLSIQEVQNVQNTSRKLAYALTLIGQNGKYLLLQIT